MTADEVMAWIRSSATREDLNRFVDAYKDRQSILNLQAKGTFKVGDRVRIAGRRVKNTGTVTKLGRSKVVVKEDGEGFMAREWNCDPAILTKLEEPVSAEASN